LSLVNPTQQQRAEVCAGYWRQVCTPLTLSKHSDESRDSTPRSTMIGWK
jgi:hypothetical protein